MPNFAGTWKMRSSENFDELLKALGVNAMLRKVAVAAASKPHVEIRQDGDQFYIKTSTTVRTTEINFKIGESFEEETVDGRKCRSLATWENENKIYCKQTLVEGDGPKTYWTRELANDELILKESRKLILHLEEVARRNLNCVRLRHEWKKGLGQQAGGKE
ncbi:cellular retinoic acid-binding protein 1 isoform X1 [Strix aluco]|uniref:cellular retinoic acid-binding protein 1 isoform X1 n=1 Tax=Strix aluco TaxID=111821 RepID=UPI003DA2E8E0